jgi:hypothetical protein
VWGFDDKTPAIIVVPVSGTNTVQLTIAGHFLQMNAWQAVTLHSDTPSVTISPSAPTGKTTLFTITAGATPVLARIKAINSDGQNLATLRVAVKSPVTSFLNLYPVIESTENIAPSLVPSAANVTTEMNRVFQKHANINFAVTNQSSVLAHYDLVTPSIGALLDPTQNAKGWLKLRASNRL